MNIFVLSFLLLLIRVPLPRPPRSGFRSILLFLCLMPENPILSHSLHNFLSSFLRCCYILIRITRVGRARPRSWSFHAELTDWMCMCECLQQSVKDNLRVYKKVVKTPKTRDGAESLTENTHSTHRRRRRWACRGRASCFEFYHEIEPETNSYSTKRKQFSGISHSKQANSLTMLNYVMAAHCSNIKKIVGKKHEKKKSAKEI